MTIREQSMLTLKIDTDYSINSAIGVLTQTRTQDLLQAVRETRSNGDGGAGAGCCIRSIQFKLNAPEAFAIANGRAEFICNGLNWNEIVLLTVHRE